MRQINNNPFTHNPHPISTGFHRRLLDTSGECALAQCVGHVSSALALGQHENYSQQLASPPKPPKPPNQCCQTRSKCEVASVRLGALGRQLVVEINRIKGSMNMARVSGRDDTILAACSSSAKESERGRRAHFVVVMVRVYGPAHVRGGIKWYFHSPCTCVSSPRRGVSQAHERARLFHAPINPGRGV